jgi:hypothetical protein
MNALPEREDTESQSQAAVWSAVWLVSIGGCELLSIVLFYGVFLVLLDCANDFPCRRTRAGDTEVPTIVDEASQ